MASLVSLEAVEDVTVSFMMISSVLTGCCKYDPLCAVAFALGLRTDVFALADPVTFFLMLATGVFLFVDDILSSNIMFIIIQF